MSIHDRLAKWLASQEEAMTLLRSITDRTKRIEKKLCRLDDQMSELSDAVATLQAAVQGVSDRVAALAPTGTSATDQAMIDDLTTKLADQVADASAATSAIADSAAMLDSVAPTTVEPSPEESPTE